MSSSLPARLRKVREQQHTLLKQLNRRDNSPSITPDDERGRAQRGTRHRVTSPASQPQRQQSAVRKQRAAQPTGEQGQRSRGGGGKGDVDGPRGGCGRRSGESQGACACSNAFEAPPSDLFNLTQHEAERKVADEIEDMISIKLEERDETMDELKRLIAELKAFEAYSVNFALKEAVAELYDEITVKEVLWRSAAGAHAVCFSCILFMAGDPRLSQGSTRS